MSEHSAEKDVLLNRIADAVTDDAHDTLRENVAIRGPLPPASVFTSTGGDRTLWDQVEQAGRVLGVAS